jgi:histone demethylase JARID1
LNLDQIEEMPVFRPTDEEFKNPIDYFEKLLTKEDVHRFGCFKVIPPASFKPPMVFDTESNKKLPSRVQDLHKLSMGEPFT